jgi:hypothetical protein
VSAQAHKTHEYNDTTSCPAASEAFSTKFSYLKDVNAAAPSASQYKDRDGESDSTRSVNYGDFEKPGSHSF